MDQLDILKSKWQSQVSDYPTYSKEQLAGLIAKKSSSIVKWLFFIAVGEILLFTALNLWSINHDSQERVTTVLGKEIFYGSNIFHYLVVAFFVYLFWNNYKKISATQPAKSLMSRILKTRSTMKWYIWYNIIYIIVFGMIAALLMLNRDPEMINLLNQASDKDGEMVFLLIYFGVFLVVFLVICGLLYLFYSLIYGILLSRLRKNYRELKKMEI